MTTTTAIGRYFYTLNFPSYESQLCELEIRSIFKQNVENKYFLSPVQVPPSRSPFLKERIAVTHEAHSLDGLIEHVQAMKTAYEDFKLVYVKTEHDTLTYEQRLKSLTRVGDAIEGEANLKTPAILLGITCVNGTWLLGHYEKDSFDWHKHDQKPFTYCHSLSFRVARALVNIAIENDTTRTLVDPCCGVGTVVLEALHMGVDIKGFEINRAIAYNAKRNVAHFEYPDVITKADMHTVEETFDAAIIDIPYGLFIPVTLEQQIAIIETGRKLAKRLVLVTFDDMSEQITNAGFTIVDRCSVTKGQFHRYVYVCE